MNKACAEKVHMIYFKMFAFFFLKVVKTYFIGS